MGRKKKYYYILYTLNLFDINSSIALPIETENFYDYHEFCELAEEAFNRALIDYEDLINADDLEVISRKEYLKLIK